MTNDQKAILALTAEVEALRARLAEVEAEHAAFSNNVEQCEAENDALRSRLADSERLREDERLTWDAQHKRQARMNAHLAALVTDAQEELRKCQQDAIQLQARLAEAEALLREAKQPLHDQMHYREEQCDARFSAYRASRVNEVYDLLRRIDAFLTPAPPAPDPAG